MGGRCNVQCLASLQETPGRWRSPLSPPAPGPTMWHEGFVRHTLSVTWRIFQVWTCPYRPWRLQRPGLYPDPSCVLLHCLSQICIPQAVSRPGHVTDCFLPTPTDPRAARVPTIKAEHWISMTVVDRLLRPNVAAPVWFPLQLSGVLPPMYVLEKF